MEQVKEFFDTFKPTVPMQILIREEFNEWFTEFETQKSPADELKELCDLLYVVYGYAHTKNWDIEKNTTEIGEILDKVTEFKEKYNDYNIMASIVGTAYMEFLVSKEYLWLYRFAQGIFTYAKYRDWPLDQAFTRVHKANMSKLEDGKVIRREDGKVLKGKNYKPADLSSLVNKKKQIKIAKAS